MLLCFVLPSVIFGGKSILNDELLYGSFVLQNFHTCEDSKDRIYLSNSCAIDSILHGLMCLYIDMPKLFEEVSENNEILELLSAHDITNVYVLRSRIARKGLPTAVKTKKDGRLLFKHQIHS